jgi:hypothetical protein
MISASAIPCKNESDDFTMWGHSKGVPGRAVNTVGIARVQLYSEGAFSLMDRYSVAETTHPISVAAT